MMTVVSRLSHMIVSRNSPVCEHRRCLVAGLAALIPIKPTKCRQSLMARRRRALATTLTDDKAMAAAAMAGESSQPKAG
jgi:hypothetical protein